MRTIAKGERQQCLSEAEKKSWSWDDFVKNDYEGYKLCRQQAEKEQLGLCGYTEIPLVSWKGTVHLDHFKKKGIYSKLRFKWNNLFAAVKDHRFGADYKDHYINGKNEKGVYAVILNPLTENLQSYFHYSTNGEIEPSNYLSNEDKEKAKNTIDVFHLNETELVNRRRTIMAQIDSYKDLPEDVIRKSFEGQGFLSVVEQEIMLMTMMR